LLSLIDFHSEKKQFFVLLRPRSHFAKIVRDNTRNHLQSEVNQHILLTKDVKKRVQQCTFTAKEVTAMTLNIASKQMDITPAIRAHIEERLAKLGKWQTQLINPHFVLSKLPQGFGVEATVGTPFGNLFASAESDDMYVAINNVEEKLEKQLNKLQHKGEARRADERLKDSFE